jgi:hypothetical protein
MTGETGDHDAEPIDPWIACQLSRDAIRSFWLLRMTLSENRFPLFRDMR